MRSTISERNRQGDEHALVLAHELAMEKKRLLLKRLFACAGGNVQLGRIATELRLTGSCCDTHLLCANEATGELMALVTQGVERGTNVSVALGLLETRLENRMQEGNRFKAKAGAPLALVYMGMGVFFPLFSGISAVILTGSLGASSSVGSLAQGFMLVTSLYVAVTLCLSAAFAHPERRVVQNIVSILPYLGLGITITLTSHAYLTGIL